VNRPYSIRVRYQNIHSETKTANLEGGPARLFQHEMSHMMCIPFWDNANFLNRSKAIKDWKQIKRRLNNPSTSGLPL
jgi:peptide deformylase